MQYSIKKDKTFWLLALFAAIYILGNIGTGSLTTWDEAFYANVSREVIQSNNWLVLRHEGGPWFDKPPLYMWCTAFFYKIFGINEFSARLTSGLFAVAAILLIYLFVKKISTDNAAIFAALILLALPHYIRFSKLGMMDVPLTFFITLMVCCFWMAQEDPRYLFLSGAAFGAAYMMKGFGAISGPAIILLYGIFTGTLRLLFKRQFLLGILLSVFAAFGWHLIQYLSAGPKAIDGYFGFHIIKRAMSAVEGHSGGINFYQKAIFNKNKPWSIIIYASVLYSLWLAIRYRDKKAILALSWIAAVYGICSIVKTKLHWYIMPIYPALAISAAIFLERFTRNKVFRITLAVILLGAVIQVPFSYAFKMDLNPNVKKLARLARALHDDGATIYLYDGYDDKELFYLGSFSLPLNNNFPSDQLLSNKKVYCVMNAAYLEMAAKKYGIVFEPVARNGDIVITGMRR